MRKQTRILRKTAICAAAVLMVGSFTASQLLSVGKKNRSAGSSPSTDSGMTITDLTGNVASDIASSFDNKVVQKLPDGIDAGREISVLVRTTDTTLVTAYDAQSGISQYSDITAFADSAAGAKVVSRIAKANESALQRIKSAGIKYELGNTYDTIIGGFELVVKASEYEKIVTALDGTTALPSISEEYARPTAAAAQLVENDVNVYETGIFNSSDSPFKGEGTLIAVLDTGFDYTHSVFDNEVFMRTADMNNLFMTRERLDGIVGGLTAGNFTRGLSTEMVYINEKIPYGYDYADKDTDVYPLDSEHGTHVAGITLGNNVGSSKNLPGDPEIIGVAPHAQLAAMKVFSDTTSGAKQSWLIAALEDCVKLGVDVINMSLGMSSGFTQETDETQRMAYENVGKAGISLVAAASNDSNSTSGSTKNGNLGLTSNPDSATVGSCSTYLPALSVASISGVKTSYIKYGNTIMYYTEAVDTASKPMNFVEEILRPYDVDTKEFEYVTVPGIGAYGDYASYNFDITGKIALVRRGTNSFEEKARVAIQDMHAAGIIIYNNVSGDISMTVGGTKGAICSISRDNGEILAANPSGKVTISRNQAAGPFMSDFSSWGPTPDLRIKPEITAHGGDILSAMPGQKYDRLSGTSMASPNQAGVTAIMREYVKRTFNLDGSNEADRMEITARVNQIMMSTTDIAYNKISLPYAVRKQGAGLANLNKAFATPAYITTYERNDAHLYDGSPRFIVDDEHIMDKAKLEYGDDRDKTGVYDLVFTINNFRNETLTYNVGALVQTEGVSETLTARGDTTVTEEGYALSPKVTVLEVNGNAHKGNSVTIAGNNKATVTLRIELSDSDKQYLDRSFANGMYVEGYVTLTAKSGTKTNLNVPFLAFYGDWTQAPLFDLDYYETNPDELDPGIDEDDKTMPDARATQPIGSMGGDYIMYLGSYPFTQNPSLSPIPAQREHNALSNQTDSSSVTGIADIWAGMLRGAKRVDLSITDASTGEVIWTRTEYNVRKSYSVGSNFYTSTIDVDFSVPEHDLKNNTQYVVRAEAFLDYGNYDEQNNNRNVFEFMFTTDFQAPVVTGVDFYTEYDKTNEKTRTYARLSIFDNHYAAAAFIGQLKYAAPESEYLYEMAQFSNYATPVMASSANSTADIVIELTDYVKDMVDSVHPNTFTVQVYDYALNVGTYEIRIPDEALQVNFKGDMVSTDSETGRQTITLSPNQTYVLDPDVWPSGEWASSLTYTVEDTSVAKIVGGKLFAIEKGETKLHVTNKINNANGKLDTTVNIVVLGPDDAGYKKLDAPGIESFRLTHYTTDNAFYFMSNKDREIGEIGNKHLFSANTQFYAVSMYPSEQVTFSYALESFDKENTTVTFRSNNPYVVSVDENGQVTALKEGTTTITVSVLINGRPTLYGATINVVVKEAYTRNGPYLTGYYGIGGVVDIAADLGADHGLTQIEQYAFSHYDYVPKDLANGDEITEEDPYASKIWYYGDNKHVTKVIIPEGVEIISMYAFAGMTGLEEVVLPTTLKQISVGAFINCTNLKYVRGLENVQLINQDAFRNTNLCEANLAKVIAVGNNAFRNTQIAALDLPATAQSIGTYAFADNNELERIEIRAASVKLGAGAFAYNPNLTVIPMINAALIPEGLFDGDNGLTSITFGADVESIDRRAFAGTSITSFAVAEGNKHFRASDNNLSLFRISNDEDEVELVCVVPTFAGKYIDYSVTKVGQSAFSGLNRLTSVELKNATEIGENAFYDCTSLTSASFGALEKIANYAFYNTLLSGFDFSNVKEIGEYAFYGSYLRTVTIPDNTIIGAHAFEATPLMSRATIGNGVVIGDYAFANAAEYTSINAYNVNTGSTVVVLHEVGYVAGSNALSTLTVGSDVTVGDHAFAFRNVLRTATLGNNVTLGDYAFYYCTALTTTTFSGVTYVGDYAFAGGLAGLAEQNEDGSYEFWADAFSIQSTNLRSVNLASATYIGEHAFEYNVNLTNVVLGVSLKEIAPYAFYSAAITNINLRNVERIGDYAFGVFTLYPFFDGGSISTYRFAAASVDLSGAVSIGAHAFEGASLLTSVTLYAGEAEEVETLAVTAEEKLPAIGAFAFANSAKLAKIENLENVLYIGAHAFERTALTGELDLTNQIEIGDYAFAYNAVENVKLGSVLADVGDNPFAGNPIKPFGTEVPVYFPANSTDPDDIVGYTFEGTFDVSEAVIVIDGVLYRKVEYTGGDLRGQRYVNGRTQYYAYGLELVSYPATAEATEYTVAAGTVRIAAGAFMNSKLVRVVLPASLNAIGDKAFYGCEQLSVVVFNGIKAPILEEQYDTDYQIRSGEDSNLPGQFVQFDINGYEYRNLGINKFPLWFISATSYYYGANFVDYIGKAAGDLIMVRPKNGTGYENFIYGQYFGSVLDGGAAADETTRGVIRAITMLPDVNAISNEEVSELKAQVAAVRKLYNAISTDEQRALVSNYQKLRDLEDRVGLDVGDPEPVKPEEKSSDNTIVIVLAIACGVLGAAIIVVCALFVVRTSKARKDEGKEETANESGETGETETQE